MTDLNYHNYMDLSKKLMELSYKNDLSNEEKELINFAGRVLRDTANRLEAILNIMDRLQLDKL